MNLAPRSGKSAETALVKVPKIVLGAPYIVAFPGPILLEGSTIQQTAQLENEPEDLTIRPVTCHNRKQHRPTQAICPKYFKLDIQQVGQKIRYFFFQLRPPPRALALSNPKPMTVLTVSTSSLLRAAAAVPAVPAVQQATRTTPTAMTPAVAMANVDTSAGQRRTIPFYDFTGPSAPPLNWRVCGESA